MNWTETALREEVHQLAAYAFRQRLISGYGDGEYPHEYQIVYAGKPRHLPLESARHFLYLLIEGTPPAEAALETLDGKC